MFTEDKGKGKNEGGFLSLKEISNCWASNLNIALSQTFRNNLGTKYLVYQNLCEVNWEPGMKWQGGKLGSGVCHTEQ